ncbi:bacterial transcriptional activator domain-containing protein [Nonomuraea sp. NBC_00507]|uniref:BTAD domain-containing putative transcriptional regulator n=1 Tax=Nonomuraea sp. NBC_00507 TaxID=2976002 RepID=UPI002E181D3B
MRIVRGLAALVILLVLLIGIPIALHVVAGPPWPAHLPSLPALIERLLARDDGSLLLLVVRLMGWGGWACFALATVLETFARMTGRRTPGVPGLAGVQRLVANLVTAVVLIGSSSTTALAATPAPAAVVVHVHDDPVTVDAQPSSPLPVEMPVAFGTGALVGGAFVTLAHLRHKQRQHRRPGQRIPLPTDPTVQRLERDLRRISIPATRADARLAAALNALSESQGRHAAPTQITGIHLTQDTLDVLTDPTADLRAAFTHIGEGRWRFHDHPANAVPTQRRAAAPPLVTAGFTDDGGRLLVQVSGVITCHGHAESIAAYLRGVAIEATTSTWAPWARIILIGLPEISSYIRPTLSCTTVHDALDLLAEGNALEPTLLISVHAAADDQLEQLRRLLRDRPSAALLPADVPSGALPHLVFDTTARPSTMHIRPDGPAVRPPMLPAETFHDISMLLGIATRVDDVEPDTPPYTENHTSPPPEHGHTTIDVRILGPFTIVGTREPLQPKQAELVLVLTLHEPHGLLNHQLGTYLGPDEDTPKPPDSVRQYITRTRRRLGPAHDGQEHILHTGNGLYRLHEVTLDWAEFQQLAEAADRDKLRTALGLVRGPALAGCDYWWLETALLESIRAAIVDTAAELADLELIADDPAAAARAARNGLAADPSAEQLWRALLRAEHAAGNLAAVHAAWQQCLRHIEEVSLDGQPHPETTKLYHQLTSRRVDAMRA